MDSGLQQSEDEELDEFDNIEEVPQESDQYAFPAEAFPAQENEESSETSSEDSVDSNEIDEGQVKPGTNSEEPVEKHGSSGKKRRAEREENLRSKEQYNDTKRRSMLTSLLEEKIKMELADDEADELIQALQMRDRAPERSFTMYERKAIQETHHRMLSPQVVDQDK